MASDRSTPSTDATPVQSTLDDHVECMESVRRVEQCLQGRPDQAWLAQLSEELPVMLNTLACHFSQEAEGPLYREVPVRYPRFADRLSALLEEHGEIARRTRQAVVRTGQLTDAEPYDLQEFAALVHLLVAKIRRHEAEENEIVIEAYWGTLGAGD